MQQDIKVTLKLHNMPSPKQLFLIYDDKWSFFPFRPFRNNKSENKNSLLLFNDFITVAPNLIDSKKLLKGCIPINKIHELQELYATSTQVVRHIILFNSADPDDISDFSIINILQEGTLASAKYFSANDIF